MSESLRSTLRIFNLTTHVLSSFVSCFLYDCSVADKNSESRLSVGVTRARGKKCDRCWYYSDSVGQDRDPNLHDVCLRCADVVRKDGYNVAVAPPSISATSAPVV